MSLESVFSAIKFLPERLNIINFQQGQKYTNQITIFNCVDVPLILKIKSSDSNKIVLSDTSLIIKPKQCKDIILTIKEDKGIKIINERKRLFLWIKGELVEEKFIIELQYNRDEHKKKIPVYLDAFEKENTSFNLIGISNVTSKSYVSVAKACQRDFNGWLNTNSIISRSAFEIEGRRNYDLVNQLNEENDRLKGTLNRIMRHNQELKQLLEQWAKKDQETPKQFNHLSVVFNETIYLNGYLYDTLQFSINDLSMKIKEIEIDNKVLIAENNTLKLRMKLTENKNSKKEKEIIEKKQEQSESNQYLRGQHTNCNKISEEDASKMQKEQYSCDLEFDYAGNKTIEEFEEELVKRHSENN